MAAISDTGKEPTLSNSKSPYHPNASHQVWAQSDLPFQSRHGLKIFKMVTMEAILDTGMEWFQQFWIFMLSAAFHQVSAQSNFFFFAIWVLQPFQEYFTSIEPIIHLRWAKPEIPGKNTWPSVSRTWFSHMWPERGSIHSCEKPNGLRVNFPIH